MYAANHASSNVMVCLKYACVSKLYLIYQVISACFLRGNRFVVQHISLTQYKIHAKYFLKDFMMWTIPRRNRAIVPIRLLWPNKRSVIMKRRHICNVVSNWLRPCSVIDGKWDYISSLCITISCTVETNAKQARRHQMGTFSALLALC